MIYSYRLGGDKCQGTNKLVSSIETYLRSMKGNMCRIMTLGGRFPLGKGVIKMQSLCKRLCLARHEIRLGYMDYNSEAGSHHKAQ